MDLPESGHDPVLLSETLDLLQPKPGQTFIDCTLGRGGHSRALLERVGPNGLLIGLDVDPNNLEYAKVRLSTSTHPFRLFHANFAEFGEVMKELKRDHVDGILADLGLSTNQLFDPQYGLSFARDMPLDMRIDPRLDVTAADLVNRLPTDELADVLYFLAQERCSRRIARKIGEARRISPIKTTERLAELVRSAIPFRGNKKRSDKRSTPEIDPATRTFLALRMKVNREMENLGDFLEKAPRFLQRGGRIAVISFQSMEDRAVKQAFRSAEQTGFLKLVNPKPLSPTDSEIAANPRSRSAKLRVAEKL
jgi:16S rRNA (cytosine1402-N4)-methyltransferase